MSEDDDIDPVETPPEPPPRPSGPRKNVRTAVVFIHGQGEQRPMDAVRELARTMWRANPFLSRTNNERGVQREDVDDALRIWSTPDDVSASFELRRLSTEGPQDDERTKDGADARRRFDFYEFYWADKMQGNRLPHVFSWFVELLRKPFGETPQAFRPIRQAIVRFAELSAIFAAAFAILTCALIFRFADKPSTTVFLQAMTEPAQLVEVAALKPRADAASPPGAIVGPDALADIAYDAGLMRDQFASGDGGQRRRALKNLAVGLDWHWRSDGLLDETGRLKNPGVATLPSAVPTHVRLLSEFAARFVMIFMAIIGLPAALASFVILDRGRDRVRGLARTIPGWEKLSPRERQSALNDRAGVRYRNQWLFIPLSAFALILLLFMVSAMSPTFEGRDLPVMLSAGAIFAFYLYEARRPGYIILFTLIAAGLLILNAPVEDGRIIGGLAVSAVATFWLAWRMNLQAATVVGVLTTLAAITARFAMAETEPLFFAEFTPDYQDLSFFAWWFFFVFAFGYPALVPTAYQSRGSRMTWLAVVIGLSTAGVIFMITADQNHWSALTRWSSVLSRPVDAARLDPRFLLHLQFWLTFVVALGALALTGLLFAADRTFLSPVMGDSARYLRARPENIAARQRIREEGVELLEKLHDEKDYDRIVVVGHSLGTIVGYDVLAHLWGRRCKSLHDAGAEPALRDVETEARELLFADMPRVRDACAQLEAAALELGVRAADLERDEPRPLSGAWEDIEHERGRQAARADIDAGCKALLLAAEQRKESRRALEAAAQSLRTGPSSFARTASYLRLAAEALEGKRPNRRRQAAADIYRLAADVFDAGAERHRRYRDRQDAYARALAGVTDDQGRKRWLVTDFVSLGSPLNFGPYILAQTDGEFAARKRDRELPICPPYLDREPPRAVRDAARKWRFSYQRRFDDERASVWGPGHGGVFGAVRWTNLYFRTEGLLGGDLLAGPCWRHFDFGVADIALDRRSTGRLFAHNDYWSSELTTDDLENLFVSGEPEHIAALRAALDLSRT